MELKRTLHPIENPAVKKVQERLNYINKSWPYLEVDGKFGPNTEMAVMAYQRYRKLPANGIVKDDTFNMLMSERFSIISAATPSSKIESGSYSIGNTDIIKQTYNVASVGVKTSISVYENVDESGNRLGRLFNEWATMLTKQVDGLTRRLNKIPANKPMRARNILKHLEKCKEFMIRASRYGISEASIVFAKNMSKEEGIKYIKNLCNIITDAPLTKTLKAVSSTMGKIKKLLQPLGKVLNKIPGLKYVSVFEKIAQGTYALFHFDFDKAFVAFLDGVRLLLEQIIIDFVVSSALVVGGWVALVIAIAIIVVFFLVDYFLFNDDPENSWLPTTNLTTQIKPTIKSFMIQSGNWEPPEGLWKGSKI